MLRVVSYHERVPLLVCVLISGCSRCLAEWSVLGLVQLGVKREEQVGSSWCLNVMR